MANNEWPDPRFLFSDMFSISFEPEILTFLWGICSKKADNIQHDYRYLLPSSSLLQVFVPYEVHRSNFITFLKNTIVTGGTLICVGVSSYGTFKVLQKLRYEGLTGIKSSLMNFAHYLKTPKKLIASHSLELLVLRTGTPAASTNLARRPSALSLNNGHANGTSPSNVLHRLNGNNVPPDYLSVSPINGDIASGDEDASEVQGQYFGPTDQGGGDSIPANDSLDAFVISPQYSNAALRERYERDKVALPLLPSPVTAHESSDS